MVPRTPAYESTRKRPFPRTLPADLQSRILLTGVEGPRSPTPRDTRGSRMDPSSTEAGQVRRWDDLSRVEVGGLRPTQGDTTRHHPPRPYSGVRDPVPPQSYDDTPSRSPGSLPSVPSLRPPDPQRSGVQVFLPVSGVADRRQGLGSEGVQKVEVEGLGG